MIHYKLLLLCCTLLQFDNAYASTGEGAGLLYLAFMAMAIYSIPYSFFLAVYATFQRDENGNLSRSFKYLTTVTFTQTAVVFVCILLRDWFKDPYDWYLYYSVLALSFALALSLIVKLVKLGEIAMVISLIPVTIVFVLVCISSM